MTIKYDGIIIGGGHNGLVASCYLSKAGKHVLVLERKPFVGGAVVTQEIYPGFRFNVAAQDAGLFNQKILADLDISAKVPFYDPPVLAFAPGMDNNSLTIWQDIPTTQKEISRFSSRDAEKYPEYLRFIDRACSILSSMTELSPPNIGDDVGIGQTMEWLKIGFDLRKLGKRDMMEFLRILPLSAKEFLDEWFENDRVKGLLGSHSVSGSMLGPRASGTAMMLLYHQLGTGRSGFRSTRMVKGGIGNLALVLSDYARELGAEIRTGASVEHILVSDEQAFGVLLSSGEEVHGKAILSNADPRHTFLDLLGASHLRVDEARRVRNIRFRGTTGKLNLALRALPEIKGTHDVTQLSGHIIICPDLDYLEHAYDDAKYGLISQNPFLDIMIPSVLDDTLAPAGHHVMSITAQYAPYRLKGSTWDEARQQLEDRILNVLSLYIPNLNEIILHKQLLTPFDLEKDFGFSEGSIYHGQMGLDQMLMRPTGGNSRYKTPVKNLYMCGAGTHPGGGVTGNSGRNAAREILKAAGG